MPRLTKSAPKSAKKKRVHDEMHKFKHGILKSSSGKKVTSRKQAIAISLSEAGESKKEKKKVAKKSTGNGSHRKKRNIGRH